MSQNDFNIANQGFPATRADINSALQALASNSAGTAEPSTTYAYQFWYDETNELLKMRNSDNDAWITIGTFDQVADTFTPAGVTTDKIEEGNSSVEVVDTGTGYVAITVDGAEAARVDGSGNVGIGLSTGIDRKLHVEVDNNYAAKFGGTGGGSDTAIEIGQTGTNQAAGFNTTAGAMKFSIEGTEALRVDGNRNVLVGKTTSALSSAGQQFQADGRTMLTRDGNQVLDINRLTSNGDIVKFYKDGSTVGNIGSNNSNAYYTGANSGIKFYASGFHASNTSGDPADNSEDVGTASVRWDDIYATNALIQTSDRNEKQDIEELTEAEQRVAVAAKALMRKFRWQSAVEKKGDAARIHFGIIAQDLQAAFEAEGLDAARYGMFISSTWWEAERVIPAVAAQDAVYETVVIPAEYDADGNEVSPETTEQRLVSEAVEAQPERTVTDTFDTQEEAPEGAVERTRMGVRYPELLAFIIAAI